MVMLIRGSTAQLTTAQRDPHANAHSTSLYNALIGVYVREHSITSKFTLHIFLIAVITHGIRSVANTAVKICSGLWQKKAKFEKD